ncbi:non-ribosomal peptide synthetase [Streptomyces sp. NBRC 109706]|uniref:non-ribosomal peptide synthetase n=1 Tax=Streptomyces sp. NBRC 109706 TaxID=1550035 RepID=UPI000785BC36|nr:non-ribosomal peptide synthetase [Streptomyces sp. NBRC 109706]
MSGDPRERETLPLTRAQLAIWFAVALDPANPAFECAEYVELSGRVEAEAFRRAVDRSLAEAVGLRARFAVVDGVPGQTIAPPELAPRTRLRDLRDRPDDEAAARSWMGEQLTVAQDPLAPDARLVDSVLLRLRDRDLWFLRIHHLLADAYAFGLVEQRAARIYTAERRGQAPPPPRIATPHEVLAAEESWLAGPGHAADLEYWARQLAGADRPTRLGRDAAPARHRHHLVAHLGPEHTDRLKAAATATGASWPALVAAAHADYAAAMTGTGDVLLGLPLTGRASPAALRSVGTQVNVLPLRLAVDPGRPLAELAGEVAERLRRARDHQGARAEAVARFLGDGQAVPAWTRATRINLKPFDTALRFGELTGRVQHLATGPVEDVEITVTAEESTGDLRVVLDANPDACTEDEARAHHRRLLLRLRRAAAGTRGRRPDGRGHLPVATDGERARLARWNATDHPVPDRTLADLLAEALDTPGPAPALRWDGGRMSRAALAGRSRALAHTLTELGVGPGGIVAVAAPRGPELVTALLAVLEAGAAFLPLDPDAPPARTGELLDQAAPLAVLAGPGVLAGPHGPALRAHGPVVEVPPADEGDEGDVPVAGRVTPRRPLSPSDPAYVLFTSGSTGAPKGVVVPHQGIVNRLLWTQHALPLGPDDVVLQKTPATFDVSVWEFFWPLLAGASLALLAPGAHRDPAAIAAAVARHGVTTLHFVPSMLRETCAHLRAADEDRRRVAPLLRRVLCSGEALDAGSVLAVHRLLPAARLVNLYGPTEAAIDVTWWDGGSGRAPRPSPDAGSVPIGGPVWNTRVAVLDAAGRELPPGGVGELWVCGVQLATGYLGRPDLTADRFVTLDPGVAGTGGATRWYRTGDRARWRASADGEPGVLEYLGRSDRQVKIRGQRVELGEIEARLAADPAVVTATVLALADAAGDLGLAALVVTATGAPDEAGPLRERLAALLPAALVPRVVVTDALPTTRHGKLDTGRAAELVASAGAHRSTAVDPGRAWSERAGRSTAAVRGAVARVLGHDAFSPEDSFFAVGGDSLKAARLVAALRPLGPGRVELADVFAGGSLDRLVALVDEGPRADADGPGTGVVLPLRPAGREVVVCVHPAGGLAWCYAPVLRHLPPDIALFGLQSPVFGEPAAAGRSLTELAGRYGEETARIADGRPVHLVGWSVGGVIAHAVAAQAGAAGFPVASLTLLDSYPAAAWRALPPPDDVDTARALATMGGLDADALATAAERAGGRLTVDAVLTALRAAGSALATVPAGVLEALPTVVAGHVRALRTHVEPVVKGDLTVVHATGSSGPEPFSAELWAHACAGAVRAVPFAGRHPDLVRAPGLGLLAGLLPLTGPAGAGR